MLDAHPDDHTTRLVFADWLQEQSDERAEGYRALGLLHRAPVINRSGVWWHKGSGADNSLPPDWYSFLPFATEKESAYLVWPSSHKIGPWTRLEIEDAAAFAFAKLPAARRAELLNPKVIA